jgi:hypothetical protein
MQHNVQPRVWMFYKLQNSCKATSLHPFSNISKNGWVYLIQAQPSLAMLSVGCTMHSTMTNSSCFNIRVAWGMLGDFASENIWFLFGMSYIQSPLTYWCTTFCIQTFTSVRAWILGETIVYLVVLYWCETLSLTLGVHHKLQVWFEVLTAVGYQDYGIQMWHHIVY